MPSTTSDPFEGVWTRIVQHAGQTFTMARGRKVTYVVNGNTVKPGHVKQQIGRPS